MKPVRRGEGEGWEVAMRGDGQEGEGREGGGGRLRRDGKETQTGAQELSVISFSKYKDEQTCMKCIEELCEMLLRGPLGGAYRRPLGLL